MRPLSLSFSGVRSYPAAFGPLDFTGKNLIAILGDTGAGKSTILEAITLALYGNCTWDHKQSKALMAEGAEQMSVDFTFAHDGHRWRVRRAFHANTTPSTHHLKNLDTGEETDNKAAVNRQVEALLKLRFDSFRTAVLLPQGQFSRLLTATGTERTNLLKDIFGVQVIETLHDHVSVHRDRLNELVNRGQVARNKLFDDPVATAATAGQAADLQERFTEHLNHALASLRETQGKATTAQGRHARLTAVATGLTQHEVKDAARRTGRIAATAADLAGQDAQADRDRQQWAAHQSTAKAELTKATQDGLTPASLHSAATILDNLPARLDGLATEHDQLHQDERDAERDASDLDTAAAQLRGLNARAACLEATRQAAATTLRDYRDAHGQLRDTVGGALREAAQVGQVHRDVHRATELLRARREAGRPLETAAASAEAARHEADRQLNTVKGHEAAHTAGTGLSPGDPCLICQRPLPGDYHPPAPADPQALAEAEQTRAAATDEERAAAKKLTQAQADIAHASSSHAERQETCRLAQNRLDQAHEAAASAMNNLTARSWGDAGSLNDEAFLAGLQAAYLRLRDADTGHDDLRARVAVQLLRPAHDLEQALDQAAESAGNTTSEANKDASTATSALNHRQAAHQQAVARTKTSRGRYAKEVADLGRDLGTLPPPARQLLPADPLAATPSHVTAARETVAAYQLHIENLSQARNDAAAKIMEIGEARHQREVQRNREVTSPLHQLTAELARWTDCIEEAATALGDGTLSVPARPATITATDINAYATAIGERAARIKDRVISAARRLHDETDQLLDRLSDMAAVLRAGQVGFPPVPIASGDELLMPSALDPVVAAHANASDAARRHRTEQTRALSQIDRATRLDTAITAGTTRLDALNALRALLSPGKFPQYLTELRTRAGG